MILMARNALASTVHGMGGDDDEDGDGELDYLGVAPAAPY